MPSTPSQKVFSGEPLPIPPEVTEPEIGAFFRKVIDYLRRLTAKLDLHNPSGGPTGSALSSFAAIMVADQSISSTFDEVGWTRELHKDACYSHSVSSNPEQITILCDGFYVVLVDYEVSDGATFPAEGNLRVTYNGITEVRSWSYGSVSASGTLSRSVSLALKADAIVDVQAKHSAGAADALLSRGTRITILKISDDSSSWEDPAPTPDPYDCLVDCVEDLEACRFSTAFVCGDPEPGGFGCPATHSVNATVLCGCLTKEWGQCANNMCIGGQCTGGTELLVETKICCYEGGEENLSNDISNEDEAAQWCLDQDPTMECFKSCSSGQCRNL